MVLERPSYVRTWIYVAEPWRRLRRWFSLALRLHPAPGAAITAASTPTATFPAEASSVTILSSATTPWLL